MSNPISYNIEAFHEKEKGTSSYNSKITSFIQEYSRLDKSQVRREAIDDVFKILCGKTLEEISEYNDIIKHDTVLNQQETIDELRSNYWNLRQELLKITGK